MLAHAELTRAAEASDTGVIQAADVDAKSLALPLSHLKSGKVNRSSAYAATCSQAHGHAPDTPRAGTPHHAPLLPSFMSHGARDADAA